MLKPGARVGVAVSGGADSVCLLHVLREIAADFQVSLAVLHLNHKLRGDESDADAEFVRALSNGLPFYSESADVGSEGGNLEQAGRDARKAFFARLRTAGAIDVVATGHTLSDQAETVLFRLLRGSGTAGLSGILPATWDGLIRPLLDCARPEVEQFLRDRGIRWREDRTNRETTFARNRIRHDLLPLIEQDYSPAVLQILAATAAIARDEESYWSGEIAALGGKFCAWRKDAVVIEASVLASLHVAVARRLVRYAVARVKGDLRGIDIAHVERILDLATQNEGHGRVQAPGLDVFRSFEWLRIGKPRLGPREERNFAFEVGGTFPAQFRLPCGSAIYLELLDQLNPRGRYTGQIEEIDQELLQRPIELRNWFPGDEFQRPGKAGVKIKTLFHDERVPIWERQTWPLITSAGQTVWTRKFGVSDQYARTAKTTRVLRVYELGGEDFHNAPLECHSHESIRTD
jgi:tRNA(Ile)-lysidine synthase